MEARSRVVKTDNLAHHGLAT